MTVSKHGNVNKLIVTTVIRNHYAHKKHLARTTCEDIQVSCYGMLKDTSSQLAPPDRPSKRSTQGHTTTGSGYHRDTLPPGQATIGSHYHRVRHSDYHRVKLLPQISQTGTPPQHTHLAGSHTSALLRTCFTCATWLRPPRTHSMPAGQGAGGQETSHQYTTKVGEIV